MPCHIRQDDDAGSSISISTTDYAEVEDHVTAADDGHQDQAPTQKLPNTQAVGQTKFASEMAEKTPATSCELPRVGGFNIGLPPGATAEAAEQQPRMKSWPFAAFVTSTKPAARASNERVQALESWEAEHNAGNEHQSPKRPTLPQPEIPVISLLLQLR